MLDVELPTPRPLITFFGIPLHPQQAGILKPLDDLGSEVTTAPPSPLVIFFSPSKLKQARSPKEPIFRPLSVQPKA